VTPPSWIFIHETDIIDRGLKVLFSVVSVFFPLPSAWKKLNTAIFGLFSVAYPPPGNFSADALVAIISILMRITKGQKTLKRALVWKICMGGKIYT